MGVHETDVVKIVLNTILSMHLIKTSVNIQIRYNNMYSLTRKINLTIPHKLNLYNTFNLKYY